MKRNIKILSLLTIMVGLVNCGSNSSKEAKELLNRILTVVGIPQDIVVNICQDGNNNGICESAELQAQVLLNKNDSLDTIWEKVSLNENNEFFLENYDPTKKIIMELQNAKEFKFDDGKFNFTYLPATQELSILQTMVDAGYLKSTDVINVKKMKGVDSFYEVLLSDTYTNLNTLRAIGLNSRQSTPSTMKEMADELLEMGIADKFPTAMNSCIDKECREGLLDELSKKLIIDEEEAKEILKEESSDENGTKEFITPTGTPFITKWNTYNDGISQEKQITIPTWSSNHSSQKGQSSSKIEDRYNYSVMWGDGTGENNITGDITHTYESGGFYTVKIYGKFPGIYFGKNGDGDISTVDNDARKLVSVIQWGDIKWESMEGAFAECRKLTISASDIPNLSNVKSTESMFFGATLFNKDIGNWNLSSVTNMSSMFSFATSFNQNISTWNVGNTTNMSSMFKYASDFNQNLGNWNVTNVTDMSSMFEGLTLSVENYDNILIGWSNQNVQKNVIFDAGHSQYNEAYDARNKILTDEYGWKILDGGRENKGNDGGGNQEEEEQYQY